MPVQKGKSPLAGKLAASLANHAKDETEYGVPSGNLPAGITSGVAQLVEAKLGKYASGRNQGQQFIYLGGVVREPKTAPNIVQAFKDGKVEVISSVVMEVAGMRTGMTLPLCDTTNVAGETTSADENIATMLNELRKLGGEECTTEVSDEASLEALLESLKEAGPHFKFDTTASKPSKEYPTQRVWERWRGNRGLEEYVAEEANAVQDETPPAPAPKAAAGKKAAPASEPEPEDDPVVLAGLADGGDAEAARKLTELAKAAGFEEEIITGAANWSVVAELLGGEGTAEGDNNPKVGNNYLYKAPGKKKAAEYEVTAVFEEKQTVNLKSLDDGKSVKNVSWDALGEV